MCREFSLCKNTNNDGGNVNFFYVVTCGKRARLHVLHWLYSGKFVIVTWMSYERCECLLVNCLYLTTSRVRIQVFAVTRGVAGRKVPDGSKGTSIIS